MVGPALRDKHIFGHTNGAGGCFLLNMHGVAHPGAEVARILKSLSEGSTAKKTINSIRPVFVIMASNSSASHRAIVVVPGGPNNLRSAPKIGDGSTVMCPMALNPEP